MALRLTKPFRRFPVAAAIAAVAAATSVELHCSQLHKPNETATTPPKTTSSVSSFSRTILDSLLHAPSFPVASPAALRASYQYANLVGTKNFDKNRRPSVPTSQSDVMYRWHLPDPSSDKFSPAKPQTVVVLIGWLGAKQKHMKRYADLYTSQGFHAVTFTYPMSDVLSVEGKAEQDVESLAGHLVDLVEDDNKLVFHTFSNTGWLTYGALLAKFQKQDPSVIRNIRGCVVDSAPVAAADPQVWASGFSAAFLRKHSIATKGPDAELKPAATETAVLAVLDKFFKLVLNLPPVNRRLSGILDVLDEEQPKCPQLYIYSSADRVIPAESVESFVEKQRRAGHQVKSHNFVSSPHVDHYRSHPGLYSSLLSEFLRDSVLTSDKDSS